MLARFPARRTGVLTALAAFALAFGGSLWLHAGSTLYDTDSYYHLAVARAYHQEGALDRAPGLRFSVLAEGFGDKEWLFHRLLAPLATFGGPEAEDALAGGRLALALLGGLAAAAVAGLAARPLGGWAVLVPFWLVFASTELAWRAVRLRPELLALSLFLAAIWALGVRRPRLLGLVALVFTLSYTAWHALLGLVALAFLAIGWRERRWPWAALAYAALGVGLGLVLHPQFPHNLEVWAVQNLEYFRLRDVLPVGTEIRPNSTDVTLMVNLGWWLGLLALWRSAAPGAAAGDEDRRLADVLGLAAAVFGVLYLMMSRFSIYFVPVFTLWVLWELRRRGLRIGAWVRLPGRGRVPLAAALAVCLLVSLPEARRQLARYRARTGPGPDRVRLADREAFSRALPAGARVAADWGSTSTYLLWAPQGRYLNALDPVFMALPYPERYAALRRVLEGAEPDVPLAVATALASDYLAFSPLKEDRAFQARLPGDPRLEPRYRGYNALYRVRPAAGAFVLDWRAVPAGTPLPVPAEHSAAAWPAYPRLADPGARRREGWVDADRILGGHGDCLALVRDWEEAPGAGGAAAEPSGSRTPDRGPTRWELAPWGPTTLWLDGEPAARVAGEMRSVLGRGVLLEPRLGPGPHRMTVLTCRASSGGEPGRAGFYLVRREGAP
jgi:hypothetical protein